MAAIDDLDKRIAAAGANGALTSSARADLERHQTALRATATRALGENGLNDEESAFLSDRLTEQNSRLAAYAGARYAPGSLSAGGRCAS